MASTYENDLRLEEMATGENSGSWGTKTNNNLELVADAFSYGTEIIANADTAITIADGVADAARSLALKITSSENLTTTRVITLGPNTVSKVWIIENSTSGGQTLTISAGSGSNVTLPNGVTKIIATDGIGAAANVTELYTNLHNITIDGILSLADGSNSAPSLTNTGDTNTGLYFPAADEVGITVGGTQRLNVSATGVDVTGSLEVTTTALVTGVLTTTAATVFNGGFASNAGSTVSNADNNATLELICTDTDAASGPRLDLYRNPGQAGADGDNLGMLNFYGLNDASEKSQYLYLFSEAADAANGSEDVRFLFGGLVDGADSSLMELRHGTSATGADPEIVFNNTARDIDFRIESSNHDYAFFVDGASGGVQMGDSDQLTVGTPGHGRLALVRTNGAPQLNLFRADGSISGGDALGNLTAFSNDTDGNSIEQLAQISFQADGAFSANDNPTKMVFSTTPDASETMREVARFDNGGNFIMSSTSGTGNGTIYTETEGTNNLRMGLDAGDAIASGGNYNTFLGDRAGSAQTTGDGNTAVGYQALKDEDTHNGNTAIGYDTLRAQNVGANGNNTAVGFNSGVALDTGNNNAFFGAYSASGAIVTGAHNVGIGNESLYSLTSGQSNTAVGYQAAQTIKSGQYNVAMGREALELEDDGDGSVAIGYHALRNQNAGDGLIYNTAVGYGAGAAITDGIYNTLIGGLAGDASNTGTRNTALGYATLSNDEKGNFNTAIGYGALSVQDFDVSTNVYNVAVGYLAGNLITTGTRNTIVGGLALDHEQAGGRNVAVGYGALSTQRHTSATNVYNTAIGYESGIGLSDGQYNTLIGGLAGDSMSTADFNTAVGYNSLSAAGVSGSNVAIGRSAGQAVTGSGNTFVGTEAGELCVAASNNTILGRFSGNEGGLNISTTSNNIVLSDGDGSVAFLKRPNTGEITSGVTNHLAGAVGITSGSTASGDSKYMMAVTTDNSANTSVDFVVTTGGSSEWQPIGIRVLVSTTNTNAAGTATAEYLFCARTLNSDIGGISEVSAVGNTASFTMTVSDQNSATANRAHFKVAVADAKNRTTMYVEVISYGNLLHAARV